MNFFSALFYLFWVSQYVGELNGVPCFSEALSFFPSPLCLQIAGSLSEYFCLLVCFSASSDLLLGPSGELFISIISLFISPRHQSLCSAVQLRLVPRQGRRALPCEVRSDLPGQNSYRCCRRVWTCSSPAMSLRCPSEGALSVTCVESVLPSRSCCPGEWALCSPELEGKVCCCLLAAESTEWVFCPRKLQEVAAATWLPGSPDQLSCDTSCLSREGHQPRPPSTQVLAADQGSRRGGEGGAAQVLLIAHRPSAARCWEKEISDVPLLPKTLGVALSAQGARADRAAPRPLTWSLRLCCGEWVQSRA